MANWYLIYAYAFLTSLAVSAILTGFARRVALRLEVLDRPGAHKTHALPVPLLGGVAIVATFYTVLLGNLVLLEPARGMGFAWLDHHVFAFLGTAVKRKLFGLCAGGLIIFVLGLIDDLKTLSAHKKLLGEVLAAGVVVACGIRLDLFLPDLWQSALLVDLVGGALTVVWLLVITNAMNFLDNMDGLCGGVGVIAAFALFLALMPQDTFVCALLAVFAGALAGFLTHNLPPARIYMGDAGSLFCGFLLATASVLATFYNETTPSRVAITAPLVALSVPLFDTASVIYLRWRGGKSIFRGDTRHFSHRLVAAGMSPRQAVAFIYLVASLTGLSAVLLRQVNLWGTVLILGEVVGIFGIILVLMNARHDRRGGPTP